MPTRTCMSGSSSHPIFLKDVLSFDLSSIPYSLTNGSLRKGAKSTLCSLLQKDIHVVQQLTALKNPQVVVINGMTVLQQTKSSGADTFGEFLQKYFNILSSLLFSSNSMWSLTNTEQLHERRASAKGNIHWPQNTNQRSCHSSTKTMGKVSCQFKKKGMA